MSKHIVILEDDVAFAETVAEELQEEGFKVTLITQTQELPALLRNKDVDLILSDIMLEEAMGMDILKILKFKNEKIPIVFMTGFDGIPGLSEAMNDKMVIDVLVKPFKISSLINLINKL
ncbi:MAG: response regulator [Bdellovibrionales bacterium]|nr:response regulator [Bdellovibrionales bacterium]